MVDSSRPDVNPSTSKASLLSVPFHTCSTTTTYLAPIASWSACCLLAALALKITPLKVCLNLSGAFSFLTSSHAFPLDCFTPVSRKPDLPALSCRLVTKTRLRRRRSDQLPEDGVPVRIRSYVR